MGSGDCFDAHIHIPYVFVVTPLFLHVDTDLVFVHIAGKSKHQTFPKISPSMVDLQSVQVIGGTAHPILIKVHGMYKYND